MTRKTAGKKKPKASAKKSKPHQVKNPGSGTNVHKKPDLDDKMQQLTRVNRQLKRKIFDLHTIFEISRNFNAVRDFKMLLESFVLTCLGQVGASRGAIYLRKDILAKEYTLACQRGSGKPPNEELVFDVESSLVEYLRGLNRPVSVRENLNDLSSAAEIEILDSFAQGVIVPLVFQTRVAGLFLLAGKISGNDFNPDDLEFLSGLGNQISVAIENTRLFEAERSAVLQLRSAQQQLVQTERMAALGEMSARIAHEVNNPLGIIKNYILLLKRDSTSAAEIDEYTDIVGQEIDRIAAIVRQLREYQRPARTAPEPVDISTIMDETLRLMARQLRSDNITLEREIDPGEFIVKGHTDSIKQVFLNLIMNARSAMSGGGRLTISMRRENSDLVTQFCDTGGGVPVENIPRLFEPYFTTKGEKGTGLGLSVCYGIISSLGGLITYKNTTQGGCFEIRLPLTEERMADDTKR